MSSLPGSVLKMLVESRGLCSQNCVLEADSGKLDIKGSEPSQAYCIISGGRIHQNTKV